MSGAVEALHHLELMALNTAQTAAAASKVNECVALLTASRTTPPARSYADGVRAVLEQQMQDQDENLPSSIARERGLVWLEGWFDLEAAIRLLSQGGKA